MQFCFHVYLTERFQYSINTTSQGLFTQATDYSLHRRSTFTGR